MGHLVENRHEKIFINEINELIDSLIESRDTVNRAILISKRAMSKLLPESDRRTLDIIMDVLVKYYNTSEAEMAGDSREGGVMRARRIFGSLGYSRTKASYSYVGLIINRDHASVMNHCKIMTQYKETNDPLHDEYLEVEARLDVLLNRLSTKHKSKKAIR